MKHETPQYLHLLWNAHVKKCKNCASWNITGEERMCKKGSKIVQKLISHLTHGYMFSVGELVEKTMGGFVVRDENNQTYYEKKQAERKKANAFTDRGEDDDTQKVGS